MKLEFGTQQMDIGTWTFLWMRTAMVEPTGGADLNECLLAAQKIKDGSDESWIAEWIARADRTKAEAEGALGLGQRVKARLAFMRASNYYRAAFMKMVDRDQTWEYLTKSREAFHRAAALMEGKVEIADIPFETVSLPAYYLPAAGKDSSPAPTLICTNGGDSTNEELMHWMGFAAQERGWNCLVFEGPGQWSMLQRFPDQVMRPDWEEPIKAVVDWLVRKPEIDAGKIALFGPSLGSTLAARAAAFEKRIAACVPCGFVVDPYEGWHDIWPKWLQRAKPETFDRVFGIFEKMSSQVRSLKATFARMYGQSSAYRIIESMKAHSVVDLAPRIDCPLLVIYGEAEYAENEAGALLLSTARFLDRIKAPVAVHEFTFEDGWAATHCQIGAQTALQNVVLDWLDRVLVKGEDMRKLPELTWKTVLKHHGKNKAVASLMPRMHVGAF
jgi:pimeloyl-ACP methyl ester carboxylesterase